MKSLARACFGLITLSPFCAFVACGDDDDGGSEGGGGEVAQAGSSAQGGAHSEPQGGAVGGTAHPEGGSHEGGGGHGDAAIECQVLGELCHAADTGSGPAADCHDVGHVGNAEACAAQFASCVGTCAEVDVGMGGAGGAGADAHCTALGSLCHAAGEIDEEAQACHELGHEGNAAACAAGFDACATLCLAKLEELGHGGAGTGGAATGGAGGAQ